MLSCKMYWIFELDNTWAALPLSNWAHEVPINDAITTKNANIFVTICNELGGTHCFSVSLFVECTMIIF